MAGEGSRGWNRQTDVNHFLDDIRESTPLGGRIRRGSITVPHCYRIKILTNTVRIEIITIEVRNCTIGDHSRDDTKCKTKCRGITEKGREAIMFERILCKICIRSYMFRVL